MKLSTHLGIAAGPLLDDIENIEIILKHGSSSDLLCEFGSIGPLTECCSTVLKRIETFDQLFVAVNSKFDKNLWQQERQFRITASRCYSIFTYSKNDWIKKAATYFWPKGFTSK